MEMLDLIVSNIMGFFGDVASWKGIAFMFAYFFLNVLQEIRDELVHMNARVPE